jgi:uncharacterized protein involved in type VI secretion and phage assembly
MVRLLPSARFDIKDPDGQGRVKVTLPWAPDTGSATYEAWARLATLMGGNNRGSWFVPDVNDEVLVVFEGGDTRRPYVVGALWNGSDKPPESMDGSGNNYKKIMRSRNGVKVTLDDQDGKEKFICETPGGQKVTLKDGPAPSRSSTRTVTRSSSRAPASPSPHPRRSPSTRVRSLSQPAW